MIRDIVQDDFEEIFKMVTEFVEENLIEKTGKPELERSKQVYKDVLGNDDAYKKVIVKDDVIHAVLIMLPYYSFFNFDKRAIDAFWITNNKISNFVKMRDCIDLLEDMFKWAEETKIAWVDIVLTHIDPSIVKLLGKLGFSHKEKIYTTEV